MPSMTLSIPEDLHSLIKKHNEIRWSEIARRAMWEYARKLQELDRIAQKSKMTPEDAAEIGKKVKKAIREHYTET
jgi:hypothetical protein